jgi:hypothetical protein
MKMRQVVYLAVVAGLLMLMVGLPAMAEEGDIPMWVHQLSVTYTGRSHWGPDAITALAHIHDANHDRVEGATVTAQWTLPDGTVCTEVDEETNVQGIAEFSTFEGAGDYTICVSGVTKVGWEYDPDSNRDTCATFILPPYQPEG